MPFLLIVFLTLACFPELKSWPEPLLLDEATPYRSGWSAAATALIFLLPLLQAFFVSLRVVRPLRRNAHLRDQLLPRYERARFLHQIVLFGSFACAVLVSGWGWCVMQFWGSLPLAELIFIAPFLLTMVLSWVLFYDAENAIFQSAQRILQDDSPETAFETAEEYSRPVSGPPQDNYFFGGRWSYVLFQARQKLALVCVPLVLVLGLKELNRRIAALPGDWALQLELASFAMILALFLSMPYVVRVVLGLKKLPAGPLRTRLEAASRRLRFRCSEILLWNTRKGMANAMVVGILPWPRYVIFTDRLVQDFTPDEVEAVFGHEVGHVKHYHMVYYFLFLSLSMILLGMLAEVGLGLLFSAGLQLPFNLEPQAGDALQTVPMGALGMLYVFTVFGFLSRRCERQADIFGCRTVSCQRRDCDGHDDGVALVPGGKGLCPTGIRTFIRALDKVADVNGISRDRPGLLQSWQHSTIARRVAFLQKMLVDPNVEPVFQRRVAFVKWALFVFLGVLFGLAVLIAWLLPAQDGKPTEPQDHVANGLHRPAAPSVFG